MRDNIVLIGFMGSGKSTVGRMLSKQTNKYFIDTDALIESNENCKIRTIFESLGEQYFRQREGELADWLSQNVNNAVVSTGGGMPVFVENIQNIGSCIYLDIGFEQLLARLKNEEFDKRPLFQNIDFARTIYEARVPMYEKYANFKIDAMMAPQEICDKIVALTN